MGTDDGVAMMTLDQIARALAHEAAISTQWKRDVTRGALEVAIEAEHRCGRIYQAAREAERAQLKALTITGNLSSVLSQYVRVRNLWRPHKRGAAHLMSVWQLRQSRLRLALDGKTSRGRPTAWSTGGRPRKQYQYMGR